MSRMIVTLGAAALLVCGLGATFTALGDDTPAAKPTFGECLKLMIDNPAEHAKLCGPGHDFVISGTTGTATQDIQCRQGQQVSPTIECCSIQTVEPTPEPSC